MKINLPGLGERFAKIAGTLLMLGLFVWGVLTLVAAGGSGSSNFFGAAANAFAAVFKAVSLFIVSALLFIRLFLPGIAERFTFFLIYPKKILKETPPALSTAMRHISRRELDDAERELLKVLESHPDNTTAALLLMELYCEDHRAPDKAIILAERYYTGNRSTPGEENYRLLLLACDQYQQLGLSESALELLQKELPKRCYSTQEKNGITLRISALQKQGKKG